MLYVPVIPPSGGRPPSPRVRELAERLSREIEAFRQERRSVTDSEVRAALRLAMRWVGRESRTRVFLAALAVRVAVLVAGIVVFVAVAIVVKRFR